MKSRLLKFLITFALVVGAAEVFVRLNGKYFYALSDKVLLKVEILERSPETEVLFMGSSRFLDAIDHTVFSETLELSTEREIKSLNGATTGFDGARFAYFAKIVAENEHLTHVILEASTPSLVDGKIDFPDQKPDVTAEADSKNDERKAKFADRFESQLQDWVTSRVALVKYRKSLRADVLLKLVVLYTADSIDPNIWSRKGIVRNLFSSSDFDVAEDFEDRFVPDVITAKTIEALPGDKTLRPNHIYKNLEAISRIFEDSGIQVIWVAPPVLEKARSKNYGRKFTGYYEAISFRFGANFYDYAGLDLDEEFFRDSTHLNAKGRALFSLTLAEQLADRF